MKKIDKENASQIIGTTGVSWKVDGVRYNARWEEMEFVSVGEEEGDSDIYRVKPKVGRPPTVEKKAVVNDNLLPKKKALDWAMKRDDVISALLALGETFNPDHNRMTLLNQLKHAQKRLPLDGLKRDK